MPVAARHLDQSHLHTTWNDVQPEHSLVAPRQLLQSHFRTPYREQRPTGTFVGRPETPPPITLPHGRCRATSNRNPCRSPLNTSTDHICTHHTTTSNLNPCSSPKTNHSPRHHRTASNRSPRRPPVTISTNHSFTISHEGLCSRATFNESRFPYISS